MKVQHELSPEARQAVQSVHVAIHDGARKIAAALVILALGLVLAARVLARKGV